MRITIKNEKLTNTDLLVLFPTILATICYFEAYVVRESRTMWILRILSLVCVIFGLFFEKAQVRWYEMLFIAGTFLTCAFSANFDAVFALCCIGILYKQCSIDRISRISRNVLVVLTLIIIIGIKLKIYENVSTNINGRVRYLLGFSNANLAGFYFFILFSVIFITKKQINIVELLLLNVCNALIYSFTDSRSPFFSFLLMSIVYVTATIWKRFAEMLSFTACIVAFFSVFTAELTMSYFPQLNKVLSGRLQLYVPVIRNMELQTWIRGGKPNNLENFYLSFVSFHGIILLALLFTIVIKRVKFFYRVGMFKEAALIVALLTYGMFENVLSSFDSVATFLFWAYVMGAVETKEGVSRAYAKSDFIGIGVNSD